jgi:16S rRNA (cytosine1402-N4)-methyltransferase
MLPNVLRTNAADHVPVLAEEVRELLSVRQGETVVDGTFGAGGHSRLLTRDLAGTGKLIAIDRDPTVRPYFDRVKASARDVQLRFLRGDYAVVLSQLAGNGVKADVVLLDLGLSSMQVDRTERGFSYATDAPLDMRMDTSDELTAAEVVGTWDENELATIFRRYGEERYSRQIARGIVRRRGELPIERTGQLVDVVRASIPSPARFGEGHPAKRVFQALRIVVNHELESLEAGLPAAFTMLRPGGRLAVISFHSLEDRIVKRFLRDRARGCTCPPEFPVCVCGHEPELRILTPKPVRPSAAEIEVNPRASSARLCAGVKILGRSRSARRAERTSPRLLAGGVLWIVAFAVLLAGVVAVNVAVLRLNLQLDGVGRDRTQLKADIAELQSELSNKASTFETERTARDELGLVQADPDQTVFIRLPAK